MSDNVVKFRRKEQPKPPPDNRPKAPLPGWVPFAVLFALALVIFFAQRSGIFG